MADLRTDYLQGHPRILPFSRHVLPRTAADLLPRIEARAAYPTDRQLLADALMAQYAGVPDAGGIRGEIQRLREPTTFTVTTGHQLCLWGGPLFFTYKVLTVIRLAEELRRAFPQHHFVPVYWMASEDHDAAEANHYFQSFQQQVSYAADFTGAVGRHLLQDSFWDTLPRGWEEGKLLFRSGEKYAEGFRRFVHHLFGKYGLVILDGDDVSLKRMLVPIIKRELETSFSHAAVTRTNTALQAAGYGLQAHPREINLFWLSDAARERIERRGEGFSLADSGTALNAEEIASALQLHPDRFSPNVILRPLYQESILPNLAYIGGWGEFAYWMQLAEMFDAAGVPFPALLPRFSASLLPSDGVERLSAQGLTPEDLLLPQHLLQDKVARKLWDHSATEDALVQLQAAYDEVISTVETLDPTLARSFTGLQVENAHRGAHLLKKVRRSVRNRYPGAFEGAEALQRQWFANPLQERVLSLWSTGLDPQAFISLVHAQLSPFSTASQWIQLP